MKLCSKTVLLCLCAFLIHHVSYSQNTFGFVDGRTSDPQCIKVEHLIASKPPEVLFGIEISTDGSVYFSMNNKEWFDKIFSYANCITADIVPRERYACGTPVMHTGLFRGTVLPPLSNTTFKQNAISLTDGSVMIKIGNLPPELIGKEVEGNLVFGYFRLVCHYQYFIDIPRDLWQILPMGLYTDTLQDASVAQDTSTRMLSPYTKKVQVIIPFGKNQSEYTDKAAAALRDSLSLDKYDIEKVDIIAYASVEGREATNDMLMTMRANAVVKGLSKFQSFMPATKIITAENWIEFYRDIVKSPYAYMATLSKLDVKIKLLDKTIAAGLEPILAGHRKTIATIYLSPKTSAAKISSDSILTRFNDAVNTKQINEARILQKEIFKRIADNRLPEEYANKLEVPFERDYSELLNDQLIYKYELQLMPEFEALEEFNKLAKVDPANGKIAYNICALTLTQWQTGDDSTNTKALLVNINQLPGKGIDSSLVRRMLINYHILICDKYMRKHQYAAKDSALLFIKNNYTGLNLDDKDRYSLAKYFVFYSRQDWALGVLTPRAGELDASEDIIFYYINLLLFAPSRYEGADFKNAVLNAINMNRERYCHFFDSIDIGGASMQLLEYESLRKTYCDNCSSQKTPNQQTAGLFLPHTSLASGDGRR